MADTQFSGVTTAAFVTVGWYCQRPQGWYGMLGMDVYSKGQNWTAWASVSGHGL